MHTKITIGAMNLEIEATATELAQFIKESGSLVSKPKDVVDVMREAITSPRKSKRAPNYLAWDNGDILFIAKMAVDLGPDAKVPASAIATAMKGRPGNKRIYTTLYAMAYNIARYLKDGRKGNLSKSNIAVMAQNGYTAAMMASPRSNMLGDVRQIAVQQA